MHGSIELVAGSKLELGPVFCCRRGRCSVISEIIYIHAVGPGIRIEKREIEEHVALNTLQHTGCRLDVLVTVVGVEAYDDFLNHARGF